MKILKFIWGLVETVILVPLILLLVASIFILMVLGSFGRTYVVVVDGIRRARMGKSDGVPIEVVEVEGPQLYKVAGLDVPKPPGKLN